ncbi:tyrosine-type recombinase/integrase [Streptomyces sp. DvalAA-14]|uniref:tyrosine-type recombinase/integrase n=1 Tax=Streptomyces sp. DvalAA-14 TaxID=1839759 RepID=UPI000B8908E2|nr:tyrosine-type recombinase/integrase [Streptomyces sp. SID4948]
MASPCRSPGPIRNAHSVVTPGRCLPVKFVPPVVSRTTLRPPPRRQLTPHKLRHTAASLAIASGADVNVVQTMLGHKSATLTLDVYGHLFPDRLDEVSRKMHKRRAMILAKAQAKADKAERKARKAAEELAALTAAEGLPA